MYINKILFFVLISYLSLLTVLAVYSFTGELKLNAEENRITPVSQYSAAFSVYVDGTRCIVLEGESHGAITCNWNQKTYNS